MMLDLSDPLQHGLFMIFMLTWGLGLAARVIFDPSRISDELDAVDVASIPAYRQIRVIGFLRWLFGYLPVAGPVSMIGAIFQLAAYLTVGATVLLTWIWPNVFHTFYWLSIVVLVLAISFALRFLPWLWNKQQDEK